MRRKTLLRIALTGGALAVGGALVLVSGVVPIAASSGHWAITSAVLELGKRRSVATHALAIDELAPDRPWQVRKGAGHYEGACRPCHGSPELPLPPLGRAMTPPAPSLASAATKWEREELFYIVKHGIKLTGMPSWPAQGRDDEVHATVAFLAVLPGLDGAGYRELVYGDEAQRVADDVPGDGGLVDACARCHGSDGCGPEVAAYPRIGGQSRAYLLAALQAYAQGERRSGMMQPVAAALTDAQLATLAEHYAARSGCATTDGERDAIARGRVIATDGIPLRRVPACNDCHGPDGSEHAPEIPSLAGQWPEYLALQLALFQAGQRGGSAWAHLMDPVAAGLDAEHIADVAAYYGALAPDDERRLARSP